MQIYTDDRIAQLEKEFPFWSRLHGFWRTLPNFNPWTVSSEPGQDLEAEALQHMAGKGRSEELVNEEQEEEFIDWGAATPKSDTAEAPGNDNRSEAGNTQGNPIDFKISDSENTKVPASTRSFSQSHSRAPSVSTQSSHKRATSTAKAPISTSKRSRLDTFKVETEERESKMVDLASKRQDYKLASLAVKKQKMELTGAWEHEKERIAAEECQMALTERMQEKDHQT